MDCISEVLFTSLMLLERPPDSFQILKDLLTLSSILIWNFDCQIFDFVRINPSSREGPFILPSIRYGLQRSNYWYRTCHGANLIWNKVCFWKLEGLKGRILNLMWIYFNKFLTTFQPVPGLSFVFVTFVDFDSRWVILGEIPSLMRKFLMIIIIIMIIFGPKVLTSVSNCESKNRFPLVVVRDETFIEMKVEGAQWHCRNFCVLLQKGFKKR